MGCQKSKHGGVAQAGDTRAGGPPVAQPVGGYPVAPAMQPVAGGGGGGRVIQNQDLNGQRLVGQTLRNVDLVGCTLDNCNVHKADIVNCRVIGGTLRSVDLKGGTVVENASIRETDLFDCTLNNTQVHTLDVKGTVTLNGGRLQTGEVVPGGRIINNGGAVSDVDNYRPGAAAPASSYPAAYPAAPVAAPVAAPIAPPGGGCAPAPPPPGGAGFGAAGGGANPYGGAPAAPRQDVDDSAAPDRFKCPISLEVMQDPVMSRNGHNFEREEIIKWLQQNGHCPQTRTPMRVDELAPNRALKEEIEEWLSRQQLKQ